MKSKQKKYKNNGQFSIFSYDDTNRILSLLGNILEKLLKAVDFEVFRPTIELEFSKNVKKSTAGAKPYDYVLMFKILILQFCYGLSDEQAEYQIYDRHSFKRFLNLADGDKVPDAKTIWLFREKLSIHGLEKKIFEQFTEIMKCRGLIVNEGKMVDASFTTVPIQRNTKDENAIIKEGKGDELWNDPKEKNKKRQKDIDARWTKKNGVSVYGYKNHTKVDTVSKLITTYTVSDASVHDSQELATLISKDDEGEELHADSAYIGENQEKAISECGMINKVHERGARNKPLTDEQKESNKEKSKIRVRVEHVFGFIKNSMSDLCVRSIGIRRAATGVGIINLIYNIFRVEQLQRITMAKI